jgi:ribA/ribD-fused uncharacterized protein
MNKYKFFYNGIFSQWHKSSFEIDNIQYNCAEQYMMHQKAMLFGDFEIAEKIMNEEHPRDQKALGRKVKNFDVNVWNEKAKDIVYKGNYAKFKKDPLLLSALLETSGTLVEASPYDCVWGIGLSMNDERIHDPKNWLGTNWLGEVLTKLRDSFKS